MNATTIVEALARREPLVQSTGADDLRTWTVCGCCGVERESYKGAFPHAEDCPWLLAASVGTPATKEDANE